MAIVSELLRVREDIPHEEGEWMVFQPLGWKELEQAREARTQRGTGTIREMGAEIYRIVREVAENTNEQESAQQVDPRLLHDHEILLNSSIVQWSYEEKVEPSVIARLDEQTKNWAIDMIIKVCGLEVDRQTEMGKDSTLSIVS